MRLRTANRRRKIGSCFRKRSHGFRSIRVGWRRGYQVTEVWYDEMLKYEDLMPVIQAVMQKMDRYEMRRFLIGEFDQLVDITDMDH